MNVCLIVPTGIGAEIGGHAGDANPLCKLMAEIADTVITHPNVVNASDINEMPDNVLYVEGSMLDRFLQGKIRLERPLQNRILVVANGPVQNDTINAVNAARVTVGINAFDVLALDTPLVMKASFKGGRATGTVTGWEELVAQVEHIPFDALAIHTAVEVSRDVQLNYFEHGGVNPWGGVEALASRLIAGALSDRPVAHAPLETVTPADPELWGVLFREVDPRMAPEAISSTYLHSVLKGLNRAPRGNQIGQGIGIRDMDALVVPWGIFGPAVAACLDQRIPVIAVRENATILNEANPFALTVENYWEAAGVLMCMKAGIAPGSVRRPLSKL